MATEESPEIHRSLELDHWRFLAIVGMTFKMSVVVTSPKVDSGTYSASEHWLDLLCSISSNREPILGYSRLIKIQEISYPHILEEILKIKRNLG